MKSVVCAVVICMISTYTIYRRPVTQTPVAQSPNVPYVDRNTNHFCEHGVKTLSELTNIIRLGDDNYVRQRLQYMNVSNYKVKELSNKAQRHLKVLMDKSEFALQKRTAEVGEKNSEFNSPLQRARRVQKLAQEQAHKVGMKCQAALDIDLVQKGYGGDLGSIGHSIKHTAESTADHIKAAAEKTAELGRKAAEKTAELSKKAAEKTAEVSKKATEKTAEVSKKAAEKTKEVSKKAAEKTKEVSKKAAEKTKEIAEKGVVDATKNVENTADSVIKSGLSKTWHTANAAEDSAQDAASTAISKINSLGDKIKSVARASVFKSIQGVVKAGQTTGEGIETAGETVAHFFTHTLMQELCDKTLGKVITNLGIASVLNIGVNKVTGIEEFCDELCTTGEVEVDAEVVTVSEAIGGGPEDVVADGSAGALVSLFNVGCPIACQLGVNSVTDKLDGVEPTSSELSSAICNKLL